MVEFKLYSQIRPNSTIEFVICNLKFRNSNEFEWIRPSLLTTEAYIFQCRYQTLVFSSSKLIISRYGDSTPDGVVDFSVKNSMTLHKKICLCYIHLWSTCDRYVLNYFTQRCRCILPIKKNYICSWLQFFTTGNMWG